ncbi:MAG TPA: hypothetical protein VN830_01620 [Verrucomicrobiae bacterium]|nr:hypothetical protein [Verrucomicrobiae bacterium]
MAAEPEKKWMVDTNDRYSTIVATVISLATGSLLLPALFLREFLGVQKEKALVPYLNCWAYAGWGSLGISIFLGLVYSWLSVKWVKNAWGQPTVLSENILERLMDLSFALMMLLFLAGVGLSVWFFITAHVD